MDNIEIAVQQFKEAILKGDTAALEDLMAEDCSYGHSDGHVEGRADFINKIGDGTYCFLTMELTSQVVKETGNVAVVRHELDASTNDEGKRGEAHLYVLLVWKMNENGWQLIARQAVKKPM